MARLGTLCNFNRALTNNSNTFVSIFAIFCAFVSTFPSGLGPLGRYIDENLQKSTKLVLELFIQDQEHGQLYVNSTLWKRSLKAQFPNLYYKNFYLNRYYFC